MAKEKTKLDAFKRLDKIIAPEDRAAIMAGKMDVADLHFSLGLWIRNNWIYGNDRGGYMRPFLKTDEENGSKTLIPVLPPDMQSATILEEYEEYLKALAKGGKR